MVSSLRQPRRRGATLFQTCLLLGVLATAGPAARGGLALSPDLVVAAVSNPPSATAPGTSFALTDTTTNQGTIASASSTTRFYLSLDAVRTAGDVLLKGTRPVPALDTEAWSTGTTMVTIPSSVLLGTYWLLACADDTRDVAEASETNNCRPSSGTVVLMRPDLVETSVNPPPAAIAPGASFSVVDAVRNQGAVSAGASTTRYYLSVDPIKDPDDLQLISARSVPALAANETSIGTSTVGVPSDALTGSYRLLACADDKNKIAETAEENNCLASDGHIDILLPDLVETALTVPAATVPGGTISVTDTVVNQGGVPAGTSTTRYYLSMDPVRDAADVLLINLRSVTSLAPGAVSTGIKSVILPAGVAPALYTVLACADDAFKVRETSEANNCIAAPTVLAVGIPPPASLSYRPIVGAVTDTRAAIYARTGSSAQVQVLYGLQPDLADGILAPAQPLLTQAEHDFVGHVLISDLSPNTWYYYAVLVDGARTATYAFRTFASAESTDDLTFVLFADSLNVSKPAGVYLTATNANPAFVIQLGDFSHWDPGSPGATIQSWWTNNRAALTTAYFNSSIDSPVSIPFVHIWDDHDYGANNADKTAWFKPIATQAFLDYFPVYPLPNPGGGLWQRFSYGCADFFVLDLRSQKDPASSGDDANKSMLSGDPIPDDQKAWLKAALQASTAKWKFIVSSLSWNPSVPKQEAWGGFQTEQLELVNFIQANNITGVMFFSGDIHSGGGIDDGTNSYFPEITVPNTNMGPKDACSSGPCGSWSAGVVSPSDTMGGFATVRASPNGVDVAIYDSFGRPLKAAHADSDGVLTTQDVPLDPSLFSMAVTKPGEAVKWIVGQTYTIKWNHNIGSNRSYSVVELSRDAGQTWETIATDIRNTPTTGAYPWTVTGPATNQAIIRVTSLDGWLLAVSAGKFTIAVQ